MVGSTHGVGRYPWLVLRPSTSFRTGSEEPGPADLLPGFREALRRPKTYMLPPLEIFQKAFNKSLSLSGGRQMGLRDPLFVSLFSRERVCVFVFSKHFVRGGQIISAGLACGVEEAYSCLTNLHTPLPDVALPQKCPAPLSSFRRKPESISGKNPMAPGHRRAPV